MTYWQDSESKHNQLSPVLYGIILRLGSVKDALPQQYEYSSEKEEKLAPVMREIFVNFNKNLSSSSLADFMMRAIFANCLPKSLVNLQSSSRKLMKWMSL